jgi:aldose 1-epimerase
VSRAPSGRQYELVHGRQRAVVVEVGAGLRSYHAGGRDIVDGYRRVETCEAGRGQLLIPWPNRIAEGKYSFGGRHLQLPVNDPKTGSAIHGLTRSMQWRLRDAAADSCALALGLRANDGYPFRLDLDVTYVLESRGLSVHISAVNRGDEPCPYGAGAHPYVHLGDGGLIDGALLRAPASTTLLTDARGIPTGAEVHVDATDLDFRTPRPVGSLALDTAFTDLAADDDGITRFSLTTPAGDLGVVVWMDGTLPFAMLYSGDTIADVPRRRRGLAIEPMTCAPDAFNSGTGLIVLQPGASHTCTWGITPIPHVEDAAPARRV